MNALDPHDRADEALVDALLHRLADPRDLSQQVLAALARTEATGSRSRRRVLHAALVAAAALVTVLVLVLTKGGSEAERWLDRALARASSAEDLEFRLGILQSPIEGRLLVRGDQRLLLEVRGPLDALAFRAGVGRDEAWTISAAGRVEAGPLRDFGEDHPLARFADVVVRSLTALRAASDVELVLVPGRDRVAVLRSAREGLQVTIDGAGHDVERLEVPWLVGRLDLVRQPTSPKQDLVYEHASYHAPAEPVHAPSGEFSAASVFGFGGQRPR